MEVSLGGEGEGWLPTAGKTPGETGQRFCWHASGWKWMWPHTVVFFFPQKIVLIVQNATILTRNWSVCHFPIIFIRLNA